MWKRIQKASTVTAKEVPVGLRALVVAAVVGLGWVGAGAQGTFQDAGNGTAAAMLPVMFPSSHAANLLVLRNGDVMCFWFSGSREGASNVAIVVSRLAKGSKTWSPVVLVDREEGKSYQNPVGWEDAKGRIWLMNTAQTAGKGQADAQVLRVYSDDTGATWSKPEVMFSKAGSFLRQPMVRGERGELLLPLYYSTTSGITHGAETNYSAVEVSKDEGKTWKECLVPGSEGYVQMDILKMKAHGYVAFFRSRYADFIYRSTSTDGCGWTVPMATPLVNNNASIQAIRLKSGAIVMAFDNTRGKSTERRSQTGPRAPLAVAMSRDGGLTWPEVRDLELPAPGVPLSGAGSEGNEYSYPSVIEMPEGDVMVAYTFRRVGIKAVRFPVEWIGKGGTVGVYRPAN